VVLWGSGSENATHPPGHLLTQTPRGTTWTHHESGSSGSRSPNGYTSNYVDPAPTYSGYADTGYVGGTYEAVSTGTTGGAPLPPPPYGTVPPAGSVVPPTTPAGWDDPTRGPGGV